MLREKIYQYFRDKEKPSPKPQDEITFAPYLFMRCRRQIYYMRIAEPISNPLTEQQILKREFGKIIHKRLQEIFKEQGILLEAEDLKEFELGGLGFKYKMDGRMLIARKDLIAEIKTTWQQGFKAIEEKPDMDDIVQLALYMMFEQIDFGILLYVGRDNARMKEYHLKKNSGLWDNAQKIIDRRLSELTTLKRQIENKKLPKKDYDLTLKNDQGHIRDIFQKDGKKYKTDWHCGYCQWKDLCHADTLKKIKDHKFYINGKFI